MNAHLIIFMYIFSLVFGSWIVVYLFQISRLHKSPFIRSYKYYILFFYITLLLNLLVRYASVNTASFSIKLDSPIFMFLLNPIDLLLTAAITYWFIRLVIELQERQFSGLLHNSIIVGILLLLSLYIVGEIIYFINDSSPQV